VEDFTRLEAQQTFQVHVAAGPAPSVVLDADDNVMPELDVGVSGDTLHLKLKSDVSTRKATLRADVTTPTLAGISASGVSQVEGAVKLDQGTVELSGASRAVLSGSVEKLEVDASGASGLDSPELTVGTLDIELSGASRAELTVTESLSAALSGASSLRYRGSPQVTKSDVSGGSSIIHL
jgi:Putative auto-transporter adhesin, head GIN domain